MSKGRIKIEVNALKEGMFVADLDRPWHETPFPLQGFYIRLDDDVKALSEYCKFVFVDQARDRSKKTYDKHSSAAGGRKASGEAKNGGQKKSNTIELPPIVIKSPQHYETTVPLKKEASKAEKLHNQVYEAVDKVFLTIAQGGEVSLKETSELADGMVESVVRNPDALVWLSKMHEHDAYGYQHSIKASIWALVFGRHLGIQKSMLKTLAMGVLLSHIGKIKIAQSLLDKYPDLGPKETYDYQKYVEIGLEIAAEMDDVPKGVQAIIEYHRERHNGSGFPKGVTGERIPLLAKIAGLVDYYQEMITPRDDKMGLAPMDAVAKLYELRNIEFQQDLVERFIEAVGVYPTGTLVELNTREVGIVTGHNEERRLLPRVMLVTDHGKNVLKHGKLLDLKELNDKGKKVFIADSLPKGAFGIDEAQYLVTGATSKWSWRHLTGALSAG